MLLLQKVEVFFKVMITQTCCVLYVYIHHNCRLLNFIKKGYTYIKACCYNCKKLNFVMVVVQKHIVYVMM